MTSLILFPISSLPRFARPYPGPPIYSLITGINSAVKFYAKITEECDSEYFHYEVRGTHFRSIFCSKIYPIRLQNTNLSQMASKFKT